MKEMFKGKVNSPVTYLKEAVTREGNIVYLASNSVLPDELPNLLVIGEDENAETVKVLNIRTDGGLDVERGFQGINKAWGKTTEVARNITEYDISSLQENIDELNENKVDKVSGKNLSTNDYTDLEKTEVAKIKNLATNGTVAEIKSDVENLKTTKVDKISGKGLSTNDYNNTEKAEVAKVKDKADKTYVDEKLADKATVTDLTKKIDKTSITSDLTGDSEEKVLSQKAGSLLEEAIKNIDLSGKIDKSAITDDFNGTDIAKVLSQKGANDLLKALSDDSLFDFTQDKDISILKIKGKKESFCILTHHGTLKPELASSTVYYKYPIGFESDTKYSGKIKLQMVGANNKRFYLEVFSTQSNLVIQKLKSDEPLDDCFNSFVYVYKCYK